MLCTVMSVLSLKQRILSVKTKNTEIISIQRWSVMHASLNDNPTALQIPELQKHTELYY